MRSTTDYRHTQTGTVIIAALVITFIILLSLTIAAGNVRPIITAASALLLVFLILFSSLTVEVQGGSLTCRFGPGIIRKEIRLSDIVDARVVTNSWLTGWGIRWIPGQYMLWNVAGFQAVELDLANGKRFRVGTDEPETLLRAIEAGRGRIRRSQRTTGAPG